MNKDMSQRVMVKLNVMKQYEKKSLSKYGMIESRNLGKLQLNPCVRKPLTFDFKLDSEPYRPLKSSSLAIRPIQQSSFLQPESTCRPESESSTQIIRKNDSTKPAVRPCSAPNYPKHKPSDQRENLQPLGGSFMILKQYPTIKPAYSSIEGQRKPEKISEQYFMDFSGTSNGNGQTTVIERKEVRNQGAQVLERENRAHFCTNGPVSPDDPNASKDSLLKKYLNNEGERIKKNVIHSEDTFLKKIFIPLCIEDELEKPDAKVIRASQREKWDSQVKMSESFPVYCHNEGFLEKYVLNRWLSLYADNAFYEVNKTGGVYMHLNMVLQNNHKESIAILRSKRCSPNVTAKRKKKPTFPGKPKHITIQIVSVEKVPRDVPASSQKVLPSVPKMVGSVTRTTGRHGATERNIEQKLAQRNKDILIVHGVNRVGNIYHNTSSKAMISGIKSQLPGFFEKPLSSVEESQKKGRMILLDYVPISKQIPMHRSEGELVDHNLSLSAVSLSPEILGHTKSEASTGNSSEEHCHENRQAGTEFIAQHPPSSIQESSERIWLTSSLTGFQEVNNSFGPQESGTLATNLMQSVISAPVISIPTAQLDTCEHHGDQSRQKPSDIEGSRGNNTKRVVPTAKIY